MGLFVKIPPLFLKKIASNKDATPTLYQNKNIILRNFFWWRLETIFRLLTNYAKNVDRCLDFGGGGGVFLPSLANIYRQVVCVDIETKEAAEIIKHFNLTNAKLITGDIKTVKLEEASFDVIIAADVLEHFVNLEQPVNAIKLWLKNNGYLFTSLPSENIVYTILRKLLKMQKPVDHYHNAYEVETFIGNNGFRRIHRTFLPFKFGITPLFVISVWKKDHTSD